MSRASPCPRSGDASKAVMVGFMSIDTLDPTRGFRTRQAQLPKFTSIIVLAAAFALSLPAAGAESSDVKWQTVTVCSLAVLRIAVARPFGAGPFPTVLVLHGTHGFAQEYPRLAQALARQGR